MKLMFIQEQLRKEIQEQRLPRGTRLPSYRQMAKKYGCSLPTMENIVRGLVEEGLVESRRGSGCYVALEQGRSQHLIGIVLPFSSNQSTEGWNQMVATLRGALLSHGYLPVTVNPPSGLSGEARGQTEIRLIRKLLDKGISYLLINSLAPADHPLWEELGKLSIPVLVFNNNGSARERWDSIFSDNWQAGELAAHFFEAHGKRHPAFLTTMDGTTVEQERYQGFRRTCEQLGMDSPPMILEEALNPLQDPYPFDCLFCLNDSLCFHVQRKFAIRTRGPLLLGCDNNSACDLHSVRLSSIAQQFVRMGELAAERILYRMEHPEFRERHSIRLDVTLVDRLSR